MVRYLHIGLSVALATWAGAVAAEAAPAVGSDNAFTFRESIARNAGGGIPYDWAEVICETKLTQGFDDTGLSLVFIGEPAKGADIWAISGFDIVDLGQLWTGGPLDQDPSTPPTPEWGWVYDRNGDGRVDWLTLVDTPRAMRPPGVARESLADLFTPPENLTQAELDLVEAQVRVSYWHMIDGNFDQRPDAVIALPTDHEIGWTDGAMLLQLSDYEVTGCEWRSDADPALMAECGADADEYVTAGTGPEMGARVPVPYLVDIFGLVSSAARQCDFGATGIEARP